MDLSVIISTWNNCERLRRTLEAFAQCQVAEDVIWELVLVNNNCDDRTDEVVNDYRAQLPLVYVHEPTPGLSHGRNAGLASASGRLIVFTDDDVKPSREWLNLYWRAYCQRPNGYFFGGPIESEFEEEPPRAALLRIAPPSVRGLELGPSSRLLSSGETFISANWACPVDALREMGGFDPALGLNPASNMVQVGEESDLMNRLQVNGWLPWYLAEARIQHFVPSEKCSESHIVGRCEAMFRQATLAKVSGTMSAIALFRMYVWAVDAWLKWKIAPLVGRTGLLSYAAWRGNLTAVRMVKQRHRVRS